VVAWSPSAGELQQGITLGLPRSGCRLALMRKRQAHMSLRGMCVSATEHPEHDRNNGSVLLTSARNQRYHSLSGKIGTPQNIMSPCSVFSCLSLYPWFQAHEPPGRVVRVLLTVRPA
jgi:hypothetical protein